MFDHRFDMIGTCVGERGHGLLWWFLFVQVTAFYNVSCEQRNVGFSPKLEHCCAQQRHEAFNIFLLLA